MMSTPTATQSANRSVNGPSETTPSGTGASIAAAAIPDSTAASPTLFVQFSQYIAELIASAHCNSDSDISNNISNSTDNNTNNSHNNDADSEQPYAAIDPEQVLWVTQYKRMQYSADLALRPSSHSSLNTDPNGKSIPKPQVMTLADYAHSTPQRYELICFWLPTLAADDFHTHLPVFMRSRDIDAVYTIIVLPASVNLRPYGFVHLADTPLSAQGIDEQLQAWQFNLYDYKPKPQWLNADYWANPENWGKYRW